MVATLKVTVKGLNRTVKSMKRLQANIGKASMDTTTEISSKLAKNAKISLGRRTKGGLSARLKSLIRPGVTRKRGKKYINKVIVEGEAVFWETGVRPHWVSLDPNLPSTSWVQGTPRSRIIEWVKDVANLETKVSAGEIRAINVRIPRTRFLTKAFERMNRKAIKIAEKNLNKALK